MFRDETVLVTGGTGTFGTAFVKRALETEAREIRVFSRDELKQDEMRRHFQTERIKYYIGDVREKRTVDKAMEGVDYVFHAAALKQVPSCEFFPVEAVKTNILGTENVLDSAIEHGVRKVIVLSTDKAAYPINAMGISKAMMEKVAISKGLTQNKTIICRTRYGNVMCSRGSVIPMFLDQLKAGNQVTVTDLTMTRFMMTIEDAVELVLHAFEVGGQGELFVKKAPSADIGTLVSALSNLTGIKADMRCIGTRHGEKKYEVLVTAEEMALASDYGDFYMIPPDRRSLNYEVHGSGKIVISAESFNSDNAKRLSIDEMVQLLKKAGVE